jgi:hypothetical protein
MKSFYERKPKQICTTCEEKLFFRRDWETCTDCRYIFCQRHIGSYVDESNRAITRNSPLLCKLCYYERYLTK